MPKLIRKCFSGLLLRNGTHSPVWSEITFRDKDFSGYLQGMETDVKPAAEDGSAMLGIGSDLFVPIKVGRYKDGRVRITGKIPKPCDMQRGLPVKSWEVEGHRRRHTVVLSINEGPLVALSANQAEVLGRELQKSAKAVT